MSKSIRLGVYSHRKGGKYNLIHSNVNILGKQHAFYQSLDSNYLCWTRPINDFNKKFKFISHYDGIPFLNKHNETFGYKSNKVLKKDKKEVFSYATTVKTFEVVAIYMNKDGTANGIVQY